ncbi:uncharacterized protein LOC126681127 [Mercurialis annua]|uniref:uncharacterized protein LOC126681127 n=1 Tax=Mercurialis annua TaxID=3986 RepID=UPI00215F0D47|nr:uncharacterized protein LOC126681127 [Mercurialis annua]
MEAGMQIAVPIAGIVAAAALTFYAVSFAEIREKSFRESDDDNGEVFRPTLSSRERRARRKAEKQAKN